MGNKASQSAIVSNTVAGVYTQKKEGCNDEDTYQDSISSGRSFASVSSHQSTYSVSRPWSRVSRRRWKESTLTLPYESSKTAWPVSQLEAQFLPEFPVLSEKKGNFENLGVINSGSFGRVFKVRNIETGQVYALKVLSKSKIIKENAVQQVKDEVQIQKLCGHHPFIVGCPFHWQSRKRLYIVSDFVAGGELFNLLKTYTVLPVALVKIFIAQLAFALDFLHNAGVIYRDLKPENILLDDNGNIQLIDFGLAKWLSYGKRTRTICGTLQYMAPEVRAGEEYGHAVDWWSLGIIACLMLTGKYPNVSSSSSASSEDGWSCGVELPVNSLLDGSSVDLLQRLLQIDCAKRLRSLRTLHTIAFFKGFDFQSVKELKVKPNQLLQEYFPQGPPEKSQLDEFEEFDTVL